MRSFAGVLVTVAALLAGPAVAADLPQYAPPPVPVDNGMGGSFYLRGSAAASGIWGHDVDYACGCGATNFDFNRAGYGYSIGAGFGYETGTGLRADVTMDYLSTKRLESSGESNLNLNLRSTIALANVYYDFGLGNMGMGGMSGLGAYVGAGIGGAYNRVTDENDPIAPSGDSWSAAGAVMAGVTYDMGSMVADVGYRGIYMPQISNNNLDAPFTANNSWINEVRGTLRYRFN